MIPDSCDARSLDVVDTVKFRCVESRKPMHITGASALPIQLARDLVPQYVACPSFDH